MLNWVNQFHVFYRGKEAESRAPAQKMVSGSEGGEKLPLEEFFQFRRLNFLVRIMLDVPDNA